MAAQRTFPWDEDSPDGEAPQPERPYGTKPYGTKPYGTKPYGTKPYGTKPYGTKPYGTKPYGTKPDELDAGGLDAQEWTDDVAWLFCAGSAVLRLGAQLVLGDEELPVPAADLSSDASTQVRMGLLRPMDHELVREVVVPNPLVRRLVQRPELADAIKDDIARALATRADRAFLHGAGSPGVSGIRHDPNIYRHVAGEPPHDLLGILRAMVSTLRDRPRARFRSPGWVLAPVTLDRLTRLEAGGRSLDATHLLEHDGRDGGVLLGYPFVVSAAARDEDAGVDALFFGSDWSEVWVGAGRDVVRVDVSPDAHFASGETGVRAVLHHDVLLRDPECFVVAELPQS
jgi:hypothetical protein